MFDRPVFAINGRDYSCGDLLLAAMWWRQWPVFERHVIEGLACSRLAVEQRVKDEGRIAEAAAEFRYARNLISAAETESWLDQAGLTVEAWIEAITRGVRRATHAAHVMEAMADYPPSLHDIDGAIVPDGFCLGGFGFVALELAGRAAVANSALEAKPEEGTGNIPLQKTEGGSPPESHRDEAVNRVCEEFADRLRRWGIADARERIVNIAAIDSGCEQVINEAATPEALWARVQDNQLDWMRVEIETLTLASEHAAREARLCCLEDGLSLAQLGGEIRTQSQRRTLLLEDAAAPLRPVLLSAPPGEILEPIAVETGFQLLTVVSKSTPVLGHQDVEARARAAIVKTITDRELANRVRWSVRF